MKKRKIKIVKHDAETVTPEPTPTAEQILARKQKDEADENRDMTKAVKNWINERRENSKAEEIYSNSRLFEWEADPPKKPGNRS